MPDIKMPNCPKCKDNKDVTLGAMSFLCAPCGTSFVDNDPKITYARIGEVSGAYGNASVHVRVEDGPEEILFHFFSDEIGFDASEFIGKTREQGCELKYKKDKQWLQSPSYQVVR